MHGFHQQHIQNSVVPLLSRLAKGACLAGLLCFSHTAPGNDNAATLQGLVQQWVSLQQELSAAERDWQENQPLLQEEADLLQQQRETITREIDARRDEITEQEQRKQELQGAKTSLDKKFSRVEKILEAKEKGLPSLVQRLPDFMQEQIADNLQRLRKHHHNGQTLSLAERYELYLAIMQTIQEGTTRIHTDRIILEHPAKGHIEMTAVYLGLSRSFAVAPDGRSSAIGYPDRQKWTWEWNHDIAPSVQNAVAVLREDGRAHFVELPFSLPNSKLKPPARTSAPASEHSDK